jgi:hypothetical protein
MSLCFTLQHQQNHNRLHSKLIRNFNVYNFLCIITIIVSCQLFPIALAFQSSVPNIHYNTNQHRHLSSTPLSSSLLTSIIKRTHQGRDVSFARKQRTPVFCVRHNQKKKHSNRIILAMVTESTTQSDISLVVGTNQKVQSTNDANMIDTTTKPKSSKIEAPQAQVSFSHIQMYVDHIEELHVYQQLEKQLNEYYIQMETIKEQADISIETQKTIWNNTFTTTTTTPSSTFIAQGQDIIRQLMVGFGFRITGYQKHVQKSNTTTDNSSTTTKTVLVTSRDSNGVQFVITTTTTTQDNTIISVNDDMNIGSLSTFNNVIDSSTYS